MHVVLDVLWLILQVLVLIVWSWIKWLIPAREKSLEGEIVLVTGAASGIGQLMAVKFSKRGCTLVLWDVNSYGNEETAKMIRKAGGKAYCYTVDVSKKQMVDHAAINVRQEVGVVSILVNNAGVILGRSLLAITETEFTRTMNINTMAHVWTLKAFLPAMMQRNHGHVVTVASVLAYQGLPKLADYCASKAGAAAIHESVERETLVAGANGVKFTLVNPFLIDTGMFQGVRIKHDFLLPALSPDYVAERALLAVQTNQPVLLLPNSMYILMNVKTWLPVNCYFVIEKFFGVWNSMDYFVGRNRVN